MAVTMQLRHVSLLPFLLVATSTGTPALLPLPPPPPPPASTCSGVLHNTALGGHNIRDYLDRSMNVTRCCTTCDRTPGCIGWTLDVRLFKCFLKDKVDNPPNSYPGSISASQKRPPTPPPKPPPIHPVPAPKPPPPGAKNVLFMIADDMRPQLNCYGHPFMHTPRLDDFAAKATLFNRAYVQYAFCAPSRNSFMTGRRPDATRVWNFRQNFRLNGQGATWTTLPGNFKQHGYFVTGTGKTFHPGDPYQFDYPYSWSFDEMPYGFGGSATPGHSDWKNTTSDITSCDNVTVVCGNGVTDCPAAALVEGDPALWCSLDTSKLPKKADGGQRLLWDQVEAVYAVERLQAAQRIQQAAKARGKHRPFFVAVGFHRPHLPWVAPKEFYDLYPSAEQMPGPQHPDVPTGMPGVAWHSFRPGSNISNPMPALKAQQLRRGLYATMSYVDSLVGQVLDGLDATGLSDDTVVAFVGDHGQHAGEHNLWEKMTNFELGVRIPMIIRAPWLKESVGRRSDALVEIVDLYKTVSDLAGIPLPVDDTHPVMGFSLRAAMLGQQHASNYSFSQFAKKGKDVATAFDVCMGCFPTGGGAADFMGFTVRSAEWRWTEWFRWDKTRGQPEWNQTAASELYDHRADNGDDFDCCENANLANWTNTSAVREELARVLRGQFQHDGRE